MCIRDGHLVNKCLLNSATECFCGSTVTVELLELQSSHLDDLRLFILR